MSAMSDDFQQRNAEAIFTRLFLTPEGRANPYPLYHQLRQAAPVHRAKLGMWVLSRYDDCWAAMRDPRLGKDYAPQIEQRFGPDWRRHRSLTAGEHSMLNTTGPEHTRLRKLVTKSFTPRMIENLKPTIEKVVNQLLDPVAEAGGGNVLEAVGFPLPVTIIGELLGVPEADRPQFRELVRDLVAIFEMQPTPEQLASADAAQITIETYFLKLIDVKRRHPGEDLLSALVQAGNTGDRLSDDELVALTALLFEAGFETTTNLFGNGLLALLRHPDQVALLRRDPSLFANLPDELLRYDGTAQLANRVTEASVEVGGVTISAGEQVFALLGAGNHDPARFANPDQLDVTRTDIQPLTFGGGVHFCLGAALARAEIEITFRTLLQRFDYIELAADEPRFQDRLTLRGLVDLNVECRTASTARAQVVADTAPISGAAPATATAEYAERGLRPRAAADLRWRAELRERIESDPARRDSVPLRTGERLAATVALLKANSLFERCSAAELEQLAATAYPMSFDPGDLLCAEGGESPECYIIEEGQAVVTVGRKGVATVGEHDVVGERGVLLDTVRAATVTAMTHMITYAISRERLRALVADNRAAREWMLEEMHRRYPNLR
ncbi:MAG: cytochrome P450 [Deltaproteobacteria bacterium]|nr:cytochrome P450 [Deltaproteobacteria bacterium]